MKVTNILRFDKDDNLADDKRFEYPPVNSKADFVKRYKKGEFGNASPSWDSIDDFLTSRADPSQPYHLRNRVKGGPTFYDVDGDYVRQFRKDHGASPNFYISSMAPTAKTVIQGEVMQSPEGLYLYYTHVKKPMRDALKEWSRGVNGLIACKLLELYLNPKDLDWLKILLDRYPGHVVEFSTYSIEWGTLLGYNTVFWEVRQY